MCTLSHACLFSPGPLCSSRFFGQSTRVLHGALAACLLDDIFLRAAAAAVVVGAADAANVATLVEPGGTWWDQADEDSPSVLFAGRVSTGGLMPYC